MVWRRARSFTARSALSFAEEEKQEESDARARAARAFKGPFEVSRMKLFHIVSELKEPYVKVNS